MPFTCGCGLRIAGVQECGDPEQEYFVDLRPVRAGTLDDTSWQRPTAHFWTRSKLWIILPEDGQIFETQPAT